MDTRHYEESPTRRSRRKLDWDSDSEEDEPVPFVGGGGGGRQFLKVENARKPIEEAYEAMDVFIHIFDGDRSGKPHLLKLMQDWKLNDLKMWSCAETGRSTEQLQEQRNQLREQFIRTLKSPYIVKLEEGEEESAGDESSEGEGGFEKI